MSKDVLVSLNSSTRCMLGDFNVLVFGVLLETHPDPLGHGTQSRELPRKVAFIRVVLASMDMAHPTSTHPFRIRTITAFLNLSSNAHLWEFEFQSAGAFLRQAKQHFEALGESCYNGKAVIPDG